MRPGRYQRDGTVVAFIGLSALLIGCAAPPAAAPARASVPRAEIAAERATAADLDFCQGVTVAPPRRVVVMPESRQFAEEAVRDTWSALRDGDLERAARAADAALDADPLSFRAHMAVGVVQSRRGEHGAALLSFCQARRLDESNTAALFWIGHVRLALGSYVEAARVMRAVVAREPDRAEAHYELGVALTRAGEEEEALEALERAAELAPDNARVHHERGYLLAGARRATEAAQAYREAIRLRPGHAASHRELSAVLIELGEHRAAFEAAREAVRAGPADLANHLALARAALAADRCRPARRALGEARGVRIGEREREELRELERAIDSTCR